MDLKNVAVNIRIKRLKNRAKNTIALDTNYNPYGMIIAAKYSGDGILKFVISTQHLKRIVYNSLFCSRNYVLQPYVLN